MKPSTHMEYISIGSKFKLGWWLYINDNNYSFTEDEEIARQFAIEHGCELHLDPY